MFQISESMLENYQFIRVIDVDPNRCQGTHRNFQCPYRAVGNNIQGIWEGSKYCPRHGGNKAQQKEQIESKRLYCLAKWQEQLNFQSDHPKVKSLRDEIGILRITLQTRLNQCKDDQELAMRSGSIVELLREIGKLVKSCDQLDQSTGQSLDRGQAKKFIESITTVLSTYITDPTLLEMITEDLTAQLPILT